MTHNDSDRAMAGGRAGYIAGLRRLADLLEQDQAMGDGLAGRAHRRAVRRVLLARRAVAA